MDVSHLYAGIVHARNMGNILLNKCCTFLFEKRTSGCKINLSIGAINGISQKEYEPLFCKDVSNTLANPLQTENLHKIHFIYFSQKHMSHSDNSHAISTNVAFIVEEFMFSYVFSKAWIIIMFDKVNNTINIKAEK